MERRHQPGAFRVRFAVCGNQNGAAFPIVRAADQCAAGYPAVSHGSDVSATPAVPEWQR